MWHSVSFHLCLSSLCQWWFCCGASTPMMKAGESERERENEWGLEAVCKQLLTISRVTIILCRHRWMGESAKSFLSPIFHHTHGERERDNQQSKKINFDYSFLLTLGRILIWNQHPTYKPMKISIQNSKDIYTLGFGEQMEKPLKVTNKRLTHDFSAFNLCLFYVHFEIYARRFYNALHPHKHILCCFISNLFSFTVGVRRNWAHNIETIDVIEACLE